MTPSPFAFTLLACAGLSSAAWAQAGFALASDTLARPAAQVREADTPVRPGDAAYPPGLAARGVQGRVVVRVSVTAQGKAGTVAVDSSSGSPELDQAALALARSYPYAPARQGVAPSEVLVPFRFSKDSPSTLPAKTCADFNTDKAWFLAAHPGRQASDMEVVKMALDLLPFTPPGPQIMPSTQERSAIAAAAIAACAGRPGDRLLSAMQREAAKLSRK